MSRVLLKLKDQVLQDYLVEQQRAYQQALEASSAQDEKEEDVDGEELS